MQVKCPICKVTTVWEENPYRPFCSERCKLIDLGNWAAEVYRIPDKEIEAASKEFQDTDGSDRNGQKN